MKLNRERAARVLADATMLGDAKAAEKWKITTRTVENYRARLATDAELSGLFGRYCREADATWHAARTQFLRKGLQKLEKLVEEAGVEQLDDVSKALERVGNLDVASQVLNVGAGSDRSGRAPEEASGESREGAGLQH